MYIRWRRPYIVLSLAPTVSSHDVQKSQRELERSGELRAPIVTLNLNSNVLVQCSLTLNCLFTC